MSKNLITTFTIKICLIFLVLVNNTNAATIKSTTNQISFDPNNDGNTDMIIFSTSVGIGTASPSTNIEMEVAGNTSIMNGNLGIGTSSPNSSLSITGTLSLSSESISSNTTLSNNSIVLVDPTSAGGNLELTLPDVATVTGRMYTIKKVTGGNTVRISGDTTIDGSPDLILGETTTGPPIAVELINDGSEWFILSASSNALVTGPTGLTAWYTFNETSGNTVYDRTPGTQTNGTLNGGFSFSSNALAGQFGTALSFNGSSDYVDLGDADELWFSTQVTIAVWAKAFTHDGAIWEKSNDWAYGHITFEFDGFGGNPHPYFRVNGSDFTLRSAESNSTVSTTEWVHVVGRFRNSDSEVSIFINGVKQTDTETMTANTPGAMTGYRRTFIGAMSSGGAENRFLSGYIDDLRFYYVALTDAQILELYNEKP